MTHITTFIYDDKRVAGEDFDSDAITVVAHNEKNNELAIQFHDGGPVYVYSDFPASAYSLFMDADSLGRFYRTYISGQFTSQRHDGSVMFVGNQTKEKQYVENEHAYADLNIDPTRELQESPLADWERELLGVPAEANEPVDPNSKRFGVKFHIEGTGIVAESEHTAEDTEAALTEFFTEFKREFPTRVANVIAVSRYFNG